MDFDMLKEQRLQREDKSRKGSIDKPIRECCDVINTTEDYFTLSSCSGRTVLLREGRKDKAEWLVTTHDIAELREFEEALERAEGKVWFMHEPVIIHVAARSVERGQQLVDAAKNNGFKKAGLIATRKKAVVEISGSEHISAPVYDDGELITPDYLSYLVNDANEKIKASWDRIATLTRIVQEL